jgi:hypothetical protein
VEQPALLSDADSSFGHCLARAPPFSELNLTEPWRGFEVGFLRRDRGRKGGRGGGGTRDLTWLIYLFGLVGRCNWVFWGNGLGSVCGFFLGGEGGWGGSWVGFGSG